MSLRHILLGLLEQPSSGYDLKRKLSETLSHFWAANLSQIYPLLSTLEEEGLLDTETIDSDRGPPRKLYQRTEKADEELARWLSEGPHVTQERRHYLAQVYFLDAFKDASKAMEFLESLQRVMQSRLETLTAVEQHWRESDPRYPDELPDTEFYPQLTLELGLKIFAANVEWCQRCIARIEKRRVKDAEAATT